MKERRKPTIIETPLRLNASGYPNRIPSRIPPNITIVAISGLKSIFDETA